MRKIILSIMVLTLVNVFAIDSNNVQYSVDTLEDVVTITTTSKQEVIIGDALGDTKFVLDNNSKIRLETIVAGYVELDSATGVASYQTNYPKSMRTLDDKYLQFTYTYSNVDNTSNLTLKVDMTQEGLSKPPFVIRATLEQWLAIVTSVKDGFTHMDNIVSDVKKLRAMEAEINT